MKRLVVLVLLAAACTSGETGGSPSTTAPSVGETTASTAPSTTEATSTPEMPPDHDRELAPDFSLLLRDGDTFTLSETNRPVYLIFWAEWCPICRRELPVVDEVSADYSNRVDFIAPAWKSDPEAADQAAASLFDSGVIRWGLDNDEVIFGLYGVPYQPVTVLIAADGTVYESWAGVRSEDLIRASIDELLAVGGA